MESRQNTILVVVIVMPILPSLFIFWRLYASIVVRKQYFKLADILAFLALVSNLVALGCSGRSAYYGLGKHLADPTFTAHAKIEAMRYIWVGEVTNLLAMLFAKLSIAWFLLYLDFAKRYRIIIWSTIAVIITINGVLSMVSVLAACDPVALNWDHSLEGSCWPRSSNKICGYIQSSVNMVTDVIFSAAPIMYLSSVQLPKHVQWGLRVVFLFGIFATVCSIMKLTQLQILEKTTDPTWDSVDLTIWSSAEVNIAMLAACLPPLRSQFDIVFKQFLTQSVRSSRGRTSKTLSIALHNKRTRTTEAGENDYGSELSILPPDDGDKRIMKTVNVRVIDEEGQIQSIDFDNDFRDHVDFKKIT